MEHTELARMGGRAKYEKYKDKWREFSAKGGSTPRVYPTTDEKAKSLLTVLKLPSESPPKPRKIRDDEPMPLIF